MNKSNTFSPEVRERAVRMVDVTSAAGGLQRSGLIEYHRGELKVLDRQGLQAAACGCYEADRRSYARMFPTKRASIAA